MRRRCRNRTNPLRSDSRSRRSFFERSLTRLSKPQSKTKIVGRVYCRITKLRNGDPRWGKLRFEREQRFEWFDRQPLSELAQEVTASTFWGSVFGYGAASGKVTRIEREAQTVKLIERVRLGEISTREFEQLAGFLDAERLGLAERVYNPETPRRRRALARKIGVSATDAHSEPQTYRWTNCWLCRGLPGVPSGWPRRRRPRRKAPAG
jgi:hypothetical protein